MSRSTRPSASSHRRPPDGQDADLHIHDHQPEVTTSRRQPGLLHLRRDRKRFERRARRRDPARERSDGVHTVVASSASDSTRDAVLAPFCGAAIGAYSATTACTPSVLRRPPKHAQAYRATSLCFEAPGPRGVTPATSSTSTRGSSTRAAKLSDKKGSGSLTAPDHRDPGGRRPRRTSRPTSSRSQTARSTGADPLLAGVRPRSTSASRSAALAATRRSKAMKQALGD